MNLYYVRAERVDQPSGSGELKMEQNTNENEGPSMSPNDMIREVCRLPGAEMPPDFHLYSGIWHTLSRSRRLAS